MIQSGDTGGLQLGRSVLVQAQHHPILTRRRPPKLLEQEYQQYHLALPIPLDPQLTRQAVVVNAADLEVRWTMSAHGG